jgi:glutamyl/glutaminyl-tRNA synthetase
MNLESLQRFVIQLEEEDTDGGAILRVAFPDAPNSQINDLITGRVRLSGPAELSD